MQILQFLREYWVLITFFVGEIGTLFIFAKSIHKASKCSLRNDILDIYDRCKEKRQITYYQLQSAEASFEIYKKLKGNSFVEEIINKMRDFELID